jgi:hypothetical protein
VNTPTLQEILEVAANRVSRIYSMRLAYSFTTLGNRIYDRVIERVKIEPGTIRRNISVDWKLPPLCQAVSGISDDLSTDALGEVLPQLSTVVVPVTIMRRGQLLTDLSITNEDGSPVYICGKTEAESYTEAVLLFAWNGFEEEIRNQLNHAQGNGTKPDFLEGLGKSYIEIYKLDDATSNLELAKITQKLETLGVLNFTKTPISQLLQIARYFTRHYVFWAQVKSAPGQRLRLNYSFVTRFAPEYSLAENKKLLHAVVGKVRRFLGQNPSSYLVPISRHGGSHSYHFEASAPKDLYVQRQVFITEELVGKSVEEQDNLLTKKYSECGAEISGMDEIGGPLVHLYANKLPTEVRNQMFALVRFGERPPGTIAAVLWMLIFSTLATGIYYTLWEQIIRSESQDIDFSSLFLALPALTVVWFSRAFNDETRYRVSLLSRAFVGIVAFATLYALFTILTRRGICSGQATDHQPLSPCPTWIENITSQSALLVVFILLVVATVSAIVYRIVSHVRYQNYQRTIFNKYGR